MGEDGLAHGAGGKMRERIPADMEAGRALDRVDNHDSEIAHKSLTPFMQ